MAKAPPPLHTRWKAGQSGNPSGKPKQLITKDSFTALAGKLLHLSVDELQRLKEKKDTPAIQQLVISQILASIEKGMLPDLLMAYSIGKPVDVSQVEVKDTTEELERAVPTSALLKAANGD